MNHFPLRHADGSADKRYAIAAEFCGHAEKRFVLRFCGEFVASSISMSAMVMRATGERNIRMGAAIVEERRA